MITVEIVKKKAFCFFIVLLLILQIALGFSHRISTQNTIKLMEGEILLLRDELKESKN